MSQNSDRQRLKPIQFRFPIELIDRIDAYVEQQCRRGLPVNRSDVVRSFIVKALEAIALDAKEEKTSGGRR